MFTALAVLFCVAALAAFVWFVLRGSRKGALPDNPNVRCSRCGTGPAFYDFGSRDMWLTYDDPVHYNHCPYCGRPTLRLR